MQREYDSMKHREMLTTVLDSQMVMVYNVKSDVTTVLLMLDRYMGHRHRRVRAGSLQTDAPLDGSKQIIRC